MDIMGALVGIHGLEIHEVAHDMVFRADAIAPVHVPGLASNAQGLAARVPLDEDAACGVAILSSLLIGTVFLIRFRAST